MGTLHEHPKLTSRKALLQRSADSLLRRLTMPAGVNLPLAIHFTLAGSVTLGIVCARDAVVRSTCHAFGAAHLLEQIEQERPSHGAHELPALILVGDEGRRRTGFVA